MEQWWWWWWETLLFFSIGSNGLVCICIVHGYVYFLNQSPIGGNQDLFQKKKLEPKNENRKKKNHKRDTEREREGAERKNSLIHGFSISIWNLSSSSSLLNIEFLFFSFLLLHFDFYDCLYKWIFKISKSNKSTRWWK